MKARYLTEDELCAIFAQLDPDRALVFRVALQTGLRIGDVLKIRTRDVRHVGAGAFEIRYRAEKTKKEGRALVFGDVGKQMFALRDPKRRNAFLWPGKGKNGHITRQTAWNWLKNAAKAAKIEIKGVSPHSLRKNFAVGLRKSEGLDAAQKALQHTDSAITAIYAFADVYSGADPNAPVLWCQVSELVDLICERLKQKK